MPFTIKVDELFRGEIFQDDVRILFNIRDFRVTLLNNFVLSVCHQDAQINGPILRGFQKMRAV